jgi:hypothetical protein
MDQDKQSGILSSWKSLDVAHIVSSIVLRHGSRIKREHREYFLHYFGHGIPPGRIVPEYVGRPYLIWKRRRALASLV